ncbi:MAG: CHASE2 domain-containing serine/threonine-protein kinase [Gammaproteobacteria bacterium]
MKKAFWTTDWFAGLLVVVAALLFALGDTYHRIELSAYDLGVRSASRDAGNAVAVIGIDDESIANLGRWPWPRDIHADLIDRLGKAGAKAVGFTVLMSEAQQDAGLAHIRDIKSLYDNSPLSAPDAAPEALAVPLRELGERLGAAEQALDTDSQLAASIGANRNVVLGMQMMPGEPRGNPDNAVPEWLLRDTLPDDNVEVSDGDGDVGLPATTLSIAPPIQQLATGSAAIGHLVTLLEADGKVRTEPLILEHHGALFPAMSLQLAARSLNLSVQDIRVRLGEGVQLGRLSIRTDPQLQMRTFFYDHDVRGPAFPVDSFYDVYTGKIDLAKYKDRVVLVGPTAFGLGSKLGTPLPGAMEPVEVLAHNVASILNEDFFIEPAWAGVLKWLSLLLVAAYLMFLMPRLGAMKAAAVSGGLLVLLFGTEIVLLGSRGEWVPLMLPVLTLAVGHLALTTRHFLVTERGKHRSDTESAESNRMLGLAFQQAGQLDMALEKFRRVPLADDMMEPLYNLALDFERKRQFSKAASVYQYMSDHNPEFRDIATRMKRASDAQDSMIFGLRPAGGGPGDTLIGNAIGAEKPMLGRYEIERELGRGAMGIVYQGTDPRINRTVAIKTLALAQEFEAEELAEVKDRFFREAEAAGRLNHPNIVTVYDTGEEHDLAWIAMELLTGHDLTRYTKPDNMMPIGTVLNVIARAAEGLDYAHAQNVVHRDIKPANIMYDPASNSVKIADFGIARVSNSGKTKTGMVVGTPSYMSPEQVTGQKVDGRSDLFSLGVALYQMVTLELPFQAEAATQIMYKIATEPYPDPLEVRPDLRKTCPWVSIVIKRALEKDREKRYQTGALMAKDLKACLAKMAELQKKSAAGTP